MYVLRIYYTLIFKKSKYNFKLILKIEIFYNFRYVRATMKKFSYKNKKSQLQILKKSFAIGSLFL